MVRFLNKLPLSNADGKYFVIGEEKLKPLPTFGVIDTESTLYGHANKCNFFCIRMDIPLSQYDPKLNKEYNVKEVIIKNDKASVYWEHYGTPYIHFILSKFGSYCKLHKIKPLMFAHNLNYDAGSFLFNKEKILALKPLMSGSRLLKLNYPTRMSEKYFTKKGEKRIRSKIRTISFRNSYAILPSSVSDLGKAIGLPKLDVGFSTKLNMLSPIPDEIDDKYEHEIYELIKKNYHPLTKEDEIYCRRDVDIVYEALMEFFTLMHDKFKINPSFYTIAANSIKLIKKFMVSELEKLGVKKDKKGKYIFKKSFDLENLAYLSYAGGKTEVYYNKRIEKPKEIDINSAYPWAMSELPFVSPLDKHHKKKKGKHAEYIKMREENYIGYMYCKMFIPHDTDYPVLFRRTEKGVYYIVGDCDGYWTTMEIDEAIKNGAIITRYEGIFSKVTWQPMKKFSDYLYKERKKIKDDIKRTGEPNCMEYNLKILLNSGYGRFAMDKKEDGHVVLKKCEHFASGYCTICGVEVNKPVAFIKELNEEIEKYGVEINDYNIEYSVNKELRRKYILIYNKVYHKVMDRYRVVGYGNDPSNSIDIWKRKFGIDGKENFNEYKVMLDNTLYSISAWITAGVRVKLTQMQIFLHNKSQLVIQSDTDSIYYVGNYDFKESTILGDWNLESEYDWIQCYAPKDYTKKCPKCDNGCKKCTDGVVNVIKGVSKGAKVEREKGKAISLYFIQPKTADKKDINVGSITYQLKDFKYEYPKRLFLDDGTSRPFTLDEIEKL